MQMQLQMPITMDVVIFYGTSARFTVPLLSILVPLLIKMHFNQNYHDANSVGTRDRDHGSPENVFFILFYFFNQFIVRQAI
jgi:hypothetical protein